MRSLLCQLASPAKSVNFQRAAQQCELPQAGFTLNKFVYLGYFDVLYPSASDAKDVVMGLHVAVIARKIVQQRYLACFSYFAKLLKNPMDGSQGYVGMTATNCRTDLVGARVVLRSEQGLDDREPLRRKRNPPFTTSRDELAESMN
ncbi:MAG TPA: hypothetical protein VJN94_03410 [Candidatus Binataceae bacterium]|nr:hypothetical protein [Candidatus Binataceae bacterium]